MKNLLTLVSLFLCGVAYAGDGKIRRGNNPIPNRYIVVLKAPENTVIETRDDLLRTFGGKLIYTYRAAFSGFLIETIEPIATAISRHPDVEFVEQDNVGTVSASGPTNSWALDRIDDRANPRIDGSYNYCETPPGEKAFVYVFDSGIWAAHAQFANPNAYFNRARVEQGFDVYMNGPFNNESANPCPTSHGAGFQNGEYNAAHGTATASLIGGDTVGVAPGVILRPVRIADCLGAFQASSISRAADWVLGNADDQWNGPRDPLWAAGTPRVVNMSLEAEYLNGQGDTTIDLAVQRLVAANITVVAAAGNGNGPVEGIHPTRGVTVSISPAREPNAVTVAASMGASNADPDRRWDDGHPDLAPGAGSNYGPQVDIFAPGRDLLSAFWNTTTGIRDRATSGSSFSAALVTGMVARRLSVNPGETVSLIQNWLVNEATTEAHAGPTFLTNANGAPRRLLFAPFGCRIRI